jgi:hypothetical protein
MNELNHHCHLLYVHVKYGYTSKNSIDIPKQINDLWVIAVKI